MKYTLTYNNENDHSFMVEKNVAGEDYKITYYSKDYLGLARGKYKYLVKGINLYTRSAAMIFFFETMKRQK